jgi:hypothetical protein
MLNRRRGPGSEGSGIFGDDSKYSLPTTNSGSGRNSGGLLSSIASKVLSNNSATDGSARSIHVDAPLVRSWKQSSAYTKGTYISIVCSLLCIALSYRYLRYHSSSIWFSCHRVDCHLQITPVGLKMFTWWNVKRTVSIQLSRRQLVNVLPIKTKNDNTYVSDTDLSSQWNPHLNNIKDTKNNKYKKGRAYSIDRDGLYSGPDNEGYYLTYSIHIKDAPAFEKIDNEKASNNTDAGEEDEFGGTPDAHFGKLLRPFLQPTGDESEHTYRLIMNHPYMRQQKRRVRVLVQKIDSYIKKRRHKLVIKETSALPWQGIVGTVLGVISFTLTLLLGTFYDEDEYSYTHQRGPGVRRQQQHQHPGSQKKGSTHSNQPQQPRKLNYSNGHMAANSSRR